MIKCSKGFTLIELILSLAILGILILLMFSTLIFGSKSFRTQSSNVENLSSVRSAMNYITKEIRKADNIEVADNKLTLDFSGVTVVYTHQDNAIKKNESVIISNISKFKITPNGTILSGSSLKIEIESTDINGSDKSQISSTIYLR